MKVTYIWKWMCCGFSSQHPRGERRAQAGVILDFDKDGNVIGLEVPTLRRIENPRGVDYAVTG